ncbi:hypothetical protein QYS46_23625 [Klebsiella michiganensis]|nr:hypothetical protein [Klebsiella michiganensis]
MLDEQAPTLSIQGVDLTAYADSLIERFSNPALKHRTWQIAMDGSQKLPQRMLEGIRVHLARGSRWYCCWRSACSAGCATSAVLTMPEMRLIFAIRWYDKMQKRVSASDEHQRVAALLTLEEIFVPRPAAEPAVCRAYHRRMASARRFWRASGDCRHAERLTISAF